jgi:pSer/pThr/pTyr-binding forkhead associated (FHA) protein
VTRHCEECGFVVSVGANYCPKCGAFLAQDQTAAHEAATASYSVDDAGSATVAIPGPKEDKAGSGLLVIRSGGGRAGDTFTLTGEKMTLGRSPNADVFLDDVTVSRNHAVLVRRGESWFLDDSGSLNGTYVNRQRVDSHRLEDDDEVQIGKYKLTYFVRG